MMTDVKKPIRVLQMIAPAVAGRDGKRGVNGPELRIVNTRKLYDPSKIELIFTYDNQALLWDRFSPSIDKVINFTVKGKFDWKSIVKISKLIKIYNIDVVHTQGPGSLDFFASIAAKYTKCKVVITRPSNIDAQLFPLWKKKIYKWFDRYSILNSNAIIAISKEGYEYLQEKYLIQDKLHLIHNGVDLDFFKPPSKDDIFNIRQTYGLSEKSIIIGMSAQLTPVKGWDDFIDTIGSLYKKNPLIVGMIIGDGPRYSDLVEKIKLLGLEECIIFTGHQKTVRGALNALDIFLFTSYSEGLSVSIIEALASGLPCVVTSVGGSKIQVINGHNGYRVNPGDVGEMTRRVLSLVNNKSLRRVMGGRSRKLCIKYFDSHEMVFNYQKIYCNLFNSCKNNT